MLRSVLLGEALHARQGALDHFNDGRDFNTGVGAEDGDRLFALVIGDTATASTMSEASIVLSLPPLKPTSHGRCLPGRADAGNLLMS